MNAHTKLAAHPLDATSWKNPDMADLIDQLEEAILERGWCLDQMHRVPAGSRDYVRAAEGYVRYCTACHQIREKMIALGEVVA